MSVMPASDASEESSGEISDHQKKPLLLPDLPDLPLLQVLSYLSLEDLIAVGRSSPRLGALTRAHPQLWREVMGLRPPYEPQTTDEVRGLFEVAPPPECLRLSRSEDRIWFDFRNEAYWLRSNSRVGEWCPGYRCPVLHIGVPSKKFKAEDIQNLIREIAPTLKLLYVSYCRHADLLLSFLKGARFEELEYLKISASKPFFDFDSLLIPQELVLPRLRTVCLRRGVILLAATLPSDLHRLEVDVGWKDDVSTLWLLHGLKELRISGEECPGLAQLLRFWSGPLEHLEIERMSSEIVQALGAHGLPSLQHLILGVLGSRLSEADCFPFHYEPLALDVALTGLPRLRTLRLHWADGILKALGKISPAAISALEVVVVTFSECEGYSCECRGVRRPLGSVGRYCARSSLVARLPSVLQNLVQRAPMSSLHAVFEDTRQPEIISVYFKHSVEESGCSLCLEARQSCFVNSFCRKSTGTLKGISVAQ